MKLSGMRAEPVAVRSCALRNAGLGIPAGPCGGAALAGIQDALGEANRRAALAITADSVLVLISTEGAV
jgi:hypothetical protein